MLGGMQNKKQSFCFHFRAAAYLRASRVVQGEYKTK
jgi:hypothetical protein